MSAFFFGYILTQILGGVIADRYGGEQTMYKAACIWSICTMLTPFLGRLLMMPVTVGIAFAQVLAGIAQGNIIFVIIQIPNELDITNYCTR